MPGSPRSSTSEVDVPAADVVERGDAVDGDVHLVALALECARQRFGDGGVVLGQQDGGHAASLGLPGPGWLTSRSIHIRDSHVSPSIR